MTPVHNYGPLCRYLTMAIATFSCTVAVYAKQDMTVDVWARKKAMQQLKEEGIL